MVAATKLQPIGNLSAGSLLMVQSSLCIGGMKMRRCLRVMLEVEGMEVGTSVVVRWIREILEAVLLLCMELEDSLTDR